MCYEIKEHVGGLWNSKDGTPLEFIEKEGYALESLYSDLMTIVPDEFMTFKDFPRKAEKNGHFTRDEYE